VTTNTRQSGILSYQQIKELIALGVVQADSPIEDRQIQPASLDLRLGVKAYRLLSSFLPERSEVGHRLGVMDAFQEDLVMYEIDLREGAILEKGHVYLVPLLESLTLSKDLRARANPKSTTGRLDIFTRVITDLCASFDDIEAGYKGPLYLEIVPRSFAIKLKTGMCLNQVRFIAGQTTVSDSAVKKLHADDILLFHNTSTDESVLTRDVRIDKGLFLRIDLQGSESDQNIVGYRAKKNSHIIDLSKIGYYSALDFWEPIHRRKDDSLLLEPEEFYILASKERIRVPPGYAAEMVAYEAACGEVRTHYAGFFDPGFGYGARGAIKGTQVVLEVRPHDVPFLIHDGQTFFKVVYDKMTEMPTQLYGSVLGSSYQRQALTLSKHFKV
jgi:dCTP deaminase